MAYARKACPYATVNPVIDDRLIAEATERMAALGVQVREHVPPNPPKPARNSRARARRAALPGQIARAFMDFRIGVANMAVPAAQFRNGHAVMDADHTVRRLKPDGLLSLFTEGALSADHMAAGLHYRDAYLARHSTGKASDIPSPASGACAPRLNISDIECDAIARLLRLDRVVGPHALLLVQAVAGEAKSIRDVRKGGKSRALATARLRIGLGHLARHLAGRLD